MQGMGWAGAGGGLRRTPRGSMAASARGGKGMPLPIKYESLSR